MDMYRKHREKPITKSVITEENQADVMSGKICPYCNKETVFVDSKTIYGTSYGMIYLCTPCDAYVGTHKASTQALGRLANKELRYWKKAAHSAFDILWKHKVNCGTPKAEARTNAYKWLSKELNIHPDLCHIGMMDVPDCKRVVELCKPHASKILDKLLKK